MKNSILYVVILIMGFIIAVLGVQLFSSQNIIKQQKLIITQQDQKIKELEAQVKDLSAITPENALRIGSQIVKEKGLEYLKEKFLSK